MNLLEFIKKPVTSNDLLNIVNSSIIENENLIVEVQKEQWEDGKDNKGKIIGTYKPFTENKAQESPRPNTPKIAGEPYNLNWSGDLRRKTFLKTKKASKDILITIDSKSDVVDELFETIKDYGFLSNPETIFGIQKNENLDKVTKIVNSKSLIKLKKRYV